MESLIEAPQTKGSFSPTQLSNYNADSVVIERTLVSSKSTDDATVVSFEPDFMALTETAREIIDKLNELLKTQLPDGIQSLSPEEVTPEATAERIVNGATAFFSIYAEQNPDLEGEELLNSFMNTIRSGIETGYNDAFKTLEGLGAFEFEGVKEGVETTKSLIEEKLQAFEAQKRKELGLEPAGTEESVEAATKSEILGQAGANLLSIKV